jgi:hypothetical protein
MQSCLHACIHTCVHVHPFIFIERRTRDVLYYKDADRSIIPLLRIPRHSAGWLRPHSSDENSELQLRPQRSRIWISNASHLPPLRASLFPSPSSTDAPSLPLVGTAVLPLVTDRLAAGGARSNQNNMHRFHGNTKLCVSGLNFTGRIAAGPDGHRAERNPNQSFRTMFFIFPHSAGAFGGGGGNITPQG